MGKKENIKRAKRLKEAKRKREQEALLAAGLGPAAKILQERKAKDGIKTQLNTGKVKYSQLLIEFVRPIISLRCTRVEYFNLKRKKRGSLSIG
jgi:hypothetical protein